ncbi:MAG TPA: prepilin-type N-terminal cleavage/methylation domain-containing protein, partial [Bacillus sp. (in: firmicutes)]|nr:prepilin-type N-terminal cleavage/methylation domain-containing protein [Bacillus sp. (in: firmicutes)]
MKVLKNQRGFTLIEMMIVLLVISVLLLITVP